MESQVKLPPGYTVRENRLVGFDFLNESGVIVLQHPYNSNTARRLVWEIYLQPTLDAIAKLPPPENITIAWNDGK